MGKYWLASNTHSSLDPHDSTPQIASGSFQPCFPEFMVVTNGQTDQLTDQQNKHRTRLVTTGRLWYMCNEDQQQQQQLPQLPQIEFKNSFFNRSLFSYVSTSVLSWLQFVQCLCILLLFILLFDLLICYVSSIYNVCNCHAIIHGNLLTYLHSNIHLIGSFTGQPR